MPPPSSDQRVTDLFLDAVGLPEPQRTALLRSLPARDAELRERLEHLLEADRRNSDGFLTTPPPLPPGADPDGPPAELPARIGPYRPLAVLGEGAHAIVYLAERDAPEPRRVAVKLLSRRGAPAHILRRFDQERRIIALMDHPSVARLYDAGIAADGRAYLAMEYVPGRPITEFAHAARLPLRARLELFIHACLGVEHAHQRGIIHRDLKPRNILAAPAADGPVVKVIDFGIAKAVGVDHVQGDTLTAEGQAIGTPAYMSPEQVRGDAARIDTRSDVYALGAVLYELLTGVPAVDTAASPLTVISSILEHDPARPESLNPALSGDPATILRTALAKDPARRYQSVADLRGDLERYLAGRPIIARPPSLTYAARKFVSRNRVALSAAATALLAISGAAWRSHTAQEQRFDDAIAMARDWFEGTRAIARTIGDRASRGPQLEKLAAQIDRFLAQNPAHPGLLRLKADVLGALGDLDQERGHLGAAADKLAEALTLRRTLLETHPESHDLRMDLSIAHVRLGDIAAASRLEDTALEWYQRAFELDEQTLVAQPESPRALTLMSWSCHRIASKLWDRRRVDEAFGLHTKELGIAQRLVRFEASADAWRAVSSAHRRLGLMHQALHQPGPAVDHLEQSIAAAAEAVRLGPEDRLALLNLIGCRVGYLHEMLSRVPAAEALRYAADTAAWARKLSALDPSDQEARGTLCSALGNAAYAAEVCGDAELAAALTREAQQARAKIDDPPPLDPDRQRLFLTVPR